MYLGGGGISRFFGLVKRGFPKIRGTFLGVPIIRTIVYWGLYWGTLILGNCHKDWVWDLKISGLGSGFCYPKVWKEKLWWGF